ncbi:MAG: hypothetical protein K0R05_4349 [Anaerocolumna sp.]|nr:hypothetical protein [Anaerocolumna sp.]
MSENRDVNTISGIKDYYEAVNELISIDNISYVYSEGERSVTALKNINIRHRLPQRCCLPAASPL